MKIVKISAIWCPACLITNNNFNKFIKKYKNIEVINLDYDFDDIEKYNVGGTLPVLIIYKNDKEIKRLVGEKSYKEIEESVGVLYEEI